MRLPIAFLFAFAALYAQKYAGPRPSKADVPYLLHASSLFETDAGDATEEKRKDGTAFVVAGAAAKARTPMAEPIFIMESGKIVPERIQLYRMDVKNGHREVFIPFKVRRDAGRPLRLTVTKLTGNLFRIEAGETLEPGEYSLSPENSNQVFCFQVY
jgi:hypothetical protein